LHGGVREQVALRATNERGNVAETDNIALIANKIAQNIFGVFFWDLYAQNNSNFECVTPDTHRTPTDHPKKEHPGDVVYHYLDPYLNHRVYLHTDLKSYGKNSLKISKIRAALNSLAMTVECANNSSDWRVKFMQNDQEPHEVRGLLFVSNHDSEAPLLFDETIKKIGKGSIEIARSNMIHVLGPIAITNLFSVATDIRLAIQSKELSQRYRFFYPDLTLWKRLTPDDARTAATVETLLSPYFILKHDKVLEDNGDTVLQRQGSLVYYSRVGDTVDEFVYLLDSLSRYQLVNANEQIRIRMTNRNRSATYKNNFAKAKTKYCDEWKFDEGRAAEIEAITIDSINQISPNYSPDEIGWRE
jgi:hypothetical protein